jgi:uncharacterized DUF497 family protein
MQYNFEWDLRKARLNRKKHGVSFEEGATVFQDPRMLTLYDGSHSKMEDRWITLGLSATGKLLVVNHTFREEYSEQISVRIISTRKATTREKREYQEV